MTPDSHPFIMARKWNGDATDGNEMVKINVRDNEIKDDKSRATSHGIDKKIAEGVNRWVGWGQSQFEC
jgi:hypothetical protein